MNDHNCEKCFDLIEDLLEGALDERSAGQVNSHVSECFECRHEYETQRREKEIYASYLFDAEPPPNSWTDFQKRLASEKEKSPVSAEIPAASSRPSTSVFGFLRLSPALATGMAFLLFVGGLGFVWLKTAPSEQEVAQNVAGAAPADTQLPPPDLPAKNIAGADDAPRTNPPRFGNRSLKANGKAPAVKIEPHAVFGGGRKKTKSATALNSEERRLPLRVENLENEIAGQIEKIELLLRAFRNARTDEAVETFDVEYEKRQARKLLETNARLRRAAEDYGISHAEDLLSRAEPYLLDIANLEAKPAPGRVLDIKERVKNQNIIASLQVYCCAAPR